MKNFTKKEIKKLKKYWKKLRELQDNFDFHVNALEENMQDDLKIEDIEFFMSDDGYCGIGDMSRTIELIHKDKLEEK